MPNFNFLIQLGEDIGEEQPQKIRKLAQKKNKFWSCKGQE